jgi:predicted polyphosphate/ATP-dependent NAD kinase
MSRVGIIANPASGKDIRRLVAFGSPFDNEEKVRIVRRVLLGLSAMDVDDICYMPDAYGIVDRALSGAELKTSARPVLTGITAEPVDSMDAARIMEKKNVGCIITLGGDGTNRAVAKGTLNVPILPISTGTNNVFPAMIEGTLAGLAAGIVARKRVALEESTFVSTLLEVVSDGRVVDLALVDAVVYDDVFIGSRAIWDMKKVKQIFLNRAEPDTIGLSAIGGLIHPVSAESPNGLLLEPGNKGVPVSAPVAPGLIRKIFIRRKHIMEPGRVYQVPPVPGVLALDGERERVIRKGQPLGIRLSTAGPRVVDVGKTMAAAVEKGVFTAGQ